MGGFVESKYVPGWEDPNLSFAAKLYRDIRGRVRNFFGSKATPIDLECHGFKSFAAYQEHHDRKMAESEARWRESEHYKRFARGSLGGALVKFSQREPDTVRDFAEKFKALDDE